MAVSLTKSEDLAANSISVIEKDKEIDFRSFLSKLDALTGIVGLPASTLNSVQKVAESINSDANVLNNMLSAINLKSDLKCVNAHLEKILNNF